MTERLRTLPEGIFQILANEDVELAIKTIDELEPGPDGELGRAEQGIFEVATSVLAREAAAAGLDPDEMRTAVEMVRAGIAHGE